MIVVEARQGAEALNDLHDLIQRIDLRVLDFDKPHIAIAMDAWRRYGKGRHPAGLDYGDCMSYAIAAALGAPLVYKGADFDLTDVRQITV